MVAAKQPQQPMRMAESEYLEFERKSDIKHEYIDGEVFAMVGASRAHGLITVNLTRMISNQLRGKDCNLYPADVPIRMLTGKYTYPDLSAVCGEPQFAPDVFDSLTNPTLILEILSPSTEAYDRGKKFRNYRQLPSLQAYILVSQDSPRIERFMLLENGIWGFIEVEGLENNIELASIGCTLKLAEVYEGVLFAEE
jgi:Uma2 family endonuclease